MARLLIGMKVKAMSAKKFCAEMPRLDIARKMVSLLAGLKLWRIRQMSNIEKITEEYLDTIKEIKLWQQQQTRLFGDS
jgi:hypothetical protein